MKRLLLALLLLFPFFAKTQTDPTANGREKPASETTSGKDIKPANAQPAIWFPIPAIRAVVVGISDYQEKDIPDLRFADRDAEAFANFLRSPAGGSLDKDHLQVLTNQDATAGQVAAALDWLLEQSKEGDEAIIYFSGHGDVERKTISQPGFLLCWDSPARVYMGGGTYSLAFLQEIVTTLSVQNKSKVVVISDACHAGKLAGSQIGGSQATAANLAKQFANEVKILSCQPNEFSLEGEQWGGGRGIFSYHLVDGLFGLADKNEDAMVSLFEIGRYLEDRVAAEAAPQSQMPMILGNKTERLATVNAAILTDLKKSKSGGLPVFAATEGRGLEDDVLAKLDSDIVKKYFAFKKAVAEKRFFPAPMQAGVSADDCAETLYASLSAEPWLAPLHGFMKRNYAAALQDDAQQTLNEWLKTGLDASLEAVAGGSNARLPEKVFTEKVRSFPRCLDRAAELLGAKHYMYAALKARKHFFEGYLLANSNLNPDPELGGRALVLFRQSLEWQPEQPQVYWQMSKVFGCNLRQPDSLEHYARRAVDMNPSWALPLAAAAFLLSDEYNEFDRARPLLEQASRIDPNSKDVCNAWGLYYSHQKQYGEAEQQYIKAMALDSTDAGIRNNLGTLFIKSRRYAEAEPVLKKGISLDSTVVAIWHNLGVLYLMTRRYAEAEPVLKKAIALDSTDASVWNALGYLYLTTRRYAEAEPGLKKAISLNSTIAPAWVNLGDLYNATRRYAEAEPVLKNAVSLDSTLAPAWVSLWNLYYATQRYAEAEPVLKKAIALDTTNSTSWNNLGFLYVKTGRYAEAEAALEKAIALDSTFANPRKHLGMVCFKTNRPDEARQNFLKAIALNPNYAAALLGMAYLLAAEAKTEDAFGYVEQAIGKGSTFEQLGNDEDLASLRALPEWRELMKKYFPDKVKD